MNTDRFLKISQKDVVVNQAARNLRANQLAGVQASRGEQSAGEASIDVANALVQAAQLHMAHQAREAHRPTPSDLQHSSSRPESFMGPSIKIQLREKQPSSAARIAEMSNQPSALTAGGVTLEGGSKLNMANQAGPLDVLIAPKRGRQTAESHQATQRAGIREAQDSGTLQAADREPFLGRAGALLRELEHDLPEANITSTLRGPGGMSLEGRMLPVSPVLSARAAENQDEVNLEGVASSHVMRRSK